MKNIRVVPKEFHENLSENIAQNHVKKEDGQPSVLTEKLELELRSKARFESYKEILYQKQGKVIPWYVVFYFMPGIILAFVMNSLAAFVPVSDLIENTDAPFIEKLGTRLTISLLFQAVLIVRKQLSKAIENYIIKRKKIFN